jgi:EAL and modified HD-GYP domain-containing signal transduction protein
MFPAAKIMVEILEDVHPTEEVLASCKELVAKGYKLALDDFVFSEEWLPFIKLATVIKIDFMLSSMEEIEEIVALVQPYKCKLLAEKIETYAEFQQALDMGFVYFQGYFFAKPEVLKNKDIPSSQLTLLQLITEVNMTEFDVDNLEKLINQDVSVSYKLLKYLNSAFFYRVQPLSSIRQAIAFLGERGVRQFVSLIATSKLAESKPTELIRISIIRARMLELMAEDLDKNNSADYFMMGLFSLIDAMLDHSMEYLMKQLPITDSVKNALSKKEGEMFPFLQAIESYGTGNWEKFEETSASIGIDAKRFPGFYLDAVGWADSYQ